MNTLVRRDKTICCSPDAPFLNGGLPRTRLSGECGRRERAGLLVPIERTAAPPGYAAVGTRQSAIAQPLLVCE